MKLLHMAPSDEYNMEIKKIVKVIESMNCKDSNKLAIEIKNIFSLAFGERFSYNDCVEVSGKILKQIY